MRLQFSIFDIPKALFISIFSVLTLCVALTWRMPFLSISKVRSTDTVVAIPGGKPESENEPSLLFLDAILRSPSNIYRVLFNCVLLKNIKMLTSKPIEYWLFCPVVTVLVILHGIVELRGIMGKYTSFIIPSPNESGITSTIDIGTCA